MKRTLLGLVVAPVLALLAGCGTVSYQAPGDLYEPDFGVSEPRAARQPNGYEYRSRPWTSYDER